MLPLILPPQSQPLVDGNLCHRTWYLVLETLRGYAATGADIVQSGTRLERLAFDPANLPDGALWAETDTSLVYQWQASNLEWIYVWGTCSLTQAKIAAFKATLKPADAGLLLNVTDYAHILQWSGSAFGWGPGEHGSGILQAFAVAPSGNGWHACDGSTGVTYLKADGTTDTVTLPNTASTAAYLKAGGSYAASITAAVAPGIGGSTDAHVLGLGEIPSHSHQVGFAGGLGAGSNSAVLLGSNSQTTTAVGGGGGHSHTLSGASVSSGGDPVANFEALLYFRQ